MRERGKGEGLSSTIVREMNYSVGVCSRSPFGMVFDNVDPFVLMPNF